MIEMDQVIHRYEDMYYSQGGDPNKVRHPPPTSGKNNRPNDIIRKNEVRATRVSVYIHGVGGIKE